MSSFVDSIAIGSLVAAALLVPPRGADSTAQKTYLLELTPSREGMLAAPTAKELEAIQGHMKFVVQKVSEGVISYGGKTGEGHALLVFTAADDGAARAFAEAEPAVQLGAFVPRVTPFEVKVTRELGRYVVEQPIERAVACEGFIAAPPDTVWRTWTTSAGWKQATGVDARIECRVGGPFEILWSAGEPAGSRGSEGCRVLSYLPGSMLSFEWNAPPSFGMLRFSRTHVVVRLEPAGDKGTRVSITQLGFGAGPEWAAVADYFDKAWPKVIAMLQQGLAASASVKRN